MYERKFDNVGINTNLEFKVTNFGVTIHLFNEMDRFNYVNMLVKVQKHDEILHHYVI